MAFTMVQGGVAANFLIEETAYSGVKKIAAKVCGDIQKVTDVLPQIQDEEMLLEGKRKGVILVGTIGHSPLLERLEREEKIVLDKCKNKREVYQISLIENPYPNVEKALVIAGSDKRGTNMVFPYSELIGVSAWVDWQM